MSAPAVPGELQAEASREGEYVILEASVDLPADLAKAHHPGSPGFAIPSRHEIHIVLADAKQEARGFQPVLAHEITHVLLEQLAEPFGNRIPRWVHEGIAQASSGRSLSAAERAGVIEQARAKKMTLSKSADEWANLDSQSARLAYDLALSAVEVYRQESGTAGLRNLLRNPERLARITADLDRKLGL